jgi:GxxExxY protein
VYCNGLVYELESRGLLVEREVPKQVFYRGHPIAIYKVDMIVEKKLILEVKASKHLVEADEQQLLNYLRVTDLQLGLLMHFGPKPAFKRMVSTNKPFISP